jgi:hypothetical protein
MLWGMFCITLSFAHAQVATTTEPIKGSPYIDEKYTEGTICYADKRITAPIRYNAFQDLMEYQQNGKALVLDANSNISSVQVGNTSFVTHKYEARGKQKLGYFALLDSGSLMLLSKKTIIYTPALKDRGLDGGDLPAQYKPVPDVYYYKLGDGALQEITSIKAMIAEMPSLRDELSAFVKKEKLSMKKEKDVIALVEYYNAMTGNDTLTRH